MALRKQAVVQRPTLDKLKVGDIIRVSYCKHPRKIIKFTKYNDSSTKIWVTTDLNSDSAYNWCRVSSVIELVESNSKEEKEMPKKNTEQKWAFNITAVDMLNFETICSCLSYANPIAYVDVAPKDGNDPELYIIVHDSLITKASLCDNEKLGDLLDDMISDCFYIDGGVVVPVPMIERDIKVKEKFWPDGVDKAYKQKNKKECRTVIKGTESVIDINAKARFQKLAGDIKASSYKKDERLSAEVVVSVPNVG